MGRGTFMFTIQAMVLLEWACRLCANNPGARTALSQALNNVRPKYFTGLPTSISHQRDFHLPESPVPLGSLQPLLWMLFDLVRNGLAHQYQQIVLRLADAPVYVRWPLEDPSQAATLAEAGATWWIDSEPRETGLAAARRRIAHGPPRGA
jgi:hypothetical protein